MVAEGRTEVWVCTESPDGGAKFWLTVIIYKFTWSLKIVPCDLAAGLLGSMHSKCFLRFIIFLAYVLALGFSF